MIRATNGVRRALVAATAAALTVGGFAVVATPAAAANPVTIQLLDINDFHGRIDANTVKWAGTIEQLRAADGAGGANTLLLSGGDNISASLFASASQDDQPTIDVLNAIGLDASTVGNHEFDHGFADFKNKVIDGNGYRPAQFDYLAANVYFTGTTNTVLPAYTILNVDGLKVGVIGAVTSETPSLVSPDGIQGLDFGDPVAAVNRVAAQIDDQVDVTVAEFHEGSPNPDSVWNYDQAVAGSATFAHIANDTDARVDTIFTGHTHVSYAYSAPVPGDPSKTRPILETGLYGDHIGQVVLTVDPDTDEVLTHTESNVVRTTTADATLINTYPRVSQVNDITQAAIAQAAIIGNTPVGSVTQDITTAFIGPTRDDRGSESTLGDLVANSLRDTLAPTSRGGAEIGVVNPGGLRAELTYAGDTTSNPANTDGVITYSEANGVLPFVNNLYTTSVTGAVFKQILEQQWQPVGAQRPFLHLGLSDNVQVTYNPDNANGSHITSVLIDGKPLDPNASYRIGTFSFLTAGGDNFTAFTQGTDVRDSGLLDRDGWIEYLQNNSPITPSFARREVVEHGMPQSVTAGQVVSFSLSKLDLTSLGSPANTSITVSLRPVSGVGKRINVGTFPVSGGTAQIDFTAGSGLQGAYTIAAVAQPTGTAIGIPHRPSTTTVSAPSTIAYGKDVKVTVNVNANPKPNGTVELFEGANSLGTASLIGGKATFDLGNTALRPGVHSFRARFDGDTDVAASQQKFQITVTKGATSAALTVTPDVIVAGDTTPQATVTVTADGFTPAGTVVIRRGSTVLGSGTLSDGSVVIDLAAFAKPGQRVLNATYAGNNVAKPSSVTVTITVVKAAN